MALKQTTPPIKTSAEVLEIQGGTPLEGSVRASGAKNAMTKLLVASLLSDKPCTFYNVPNIGDVEITVDLCKHLGMEVEWDQENHTMRVQTKELLSTYIPQRFSGANRIPILMIGALLGRTSEDIVVPTMGGCSIGARPVDFHIQSLTALGACIEYRNMRHDGAYFASAHQGLKGTIIELPYPSIGATENCILAACKAKGTTVIRGAAIEPEIIDIILFLQKLGANIHLDVNRTIVIHEMQHTFPVEHQVIPDRVEVASLAVAAIATKGSVFVEGARQEDMIIFLNKLRDLGAYFEVKPEGILFAYKNPLKGGIHIETDVHPGFLTDWHQPFAVLLTQAEGASVIHETVYENRFGYTQNLIDMGASLNLFTKCLGNRECRYASSNFNHSLIIHGPTPLHGKEIYIPDLRAGFAYVMAALVAEGTSHIHNLQYLDRGYEELDQKLLSLGAKIERKTV
ncbi:MAG: UDP-N-acetylglucosamine 1-carboxyvinyltransferase 1 [Chlamydiia bacterium]|nr:UDP-N-acetylglucosamine 1-carboxyvinyltransferase 1 [Chlamydiia bacterium]